MELATQNKLRYHWPNMNNSESSEQCEKVFWLRLCLDRGINESQVLRFLVAPDNSCFTDVNSIHIKLRLRVLRGDGSHIDSSDQVFLGPGSLQSLFRQSQVYLNSHALEPNPNYSYTATLSSYLALSKVSREDYWSYLAGIQPPNFPSSQLKASDVPYFASSIQRVADSKEFTLIGRLQIDALMSLTQHLPPGMKLEIELSRTPDDFSLCAASDDPKRTYKLEISTASLFVRRIQMNSVTLERCRNSLVSGGGLRYNRLATVMAQISPETSTFTWNNVWNGGQLPFSLYLILVSQRAWNGSLSTLPNFFESAAVKTVRFRHNGREVMPEPYQMNYRYLNDGYSIDVQASDASDPYMGMVRLLNSLENPSVTASLSYPDFLQGCTFYNVLLNSCGGKQMENGSIDVDIQFDESTKREPLHAIIMGEMDRTLLFDKNLNIASIH